jgi:hypothetical protein
VTQSPVEIAEPLEGITDAIQYAEKWVTWARYHRERPENEVAREITERRTAELIARLQALK